MTKYDNDHRIVMTLDAGGTNFVFSAIGGNQELVDPIYLPSHGNDLDTCLNTITDGFSQVKQSLKKPPAAISFAFPGPADYPAGIIGDLLNLPGFKGGIALGPMLEDQFDIPVFINNDGDLFVYGESIAGFLPYINKKLEEQKSPKRYKNLFGITLGTGFGGGIVHDGQLFIGDNSAGAEIWLLRNMLLPHCNIEESASIRGVQRVFMEKSGLSGNPPNPKDIYEIGKGKQHGNMEAAIQAYRTLGIAVGDALANAITLLDTLVVIGGGLAGAHSLFLDELVREMNNGLETISGHKGPRMELKAFNAENPEDLDVFLRGETRTITVPGTNKTLSYDPLKRTAVGISRLGTSKAVAIGAYAFALNKLDNNP